MTPPIPPSHSSSELRMSKPQVSLDRPQPWKPKKQASPASDLISWRETAHEKQSLLFSFVRSKGLQCFPGQKLTPT